MEPENKADRKKAFINFMLLFLLCTAIVITTVLASSRVQSKQNDDLIAYKKSVEEKNDLNKDFTAKFISVSYLIDSLDAKKSPAELAALNTRIARELKVLNDILPKVSNDDNDIYVHILKNLNNYQEAKNAAKAGTETNSSVKDLTDQIKQLNKDNFELQRDILKCQQESLKK